MTQATSKPLDLQLLDALTGGAFTAPTSGERAARIRDWLAGNPTPEQLQEVFRELSGRDKGAAKPVREKLDELKRAKGQEALAAEWSTKGQALLESPKLNIADAMAWQRDAAKAGAPLSREPLAGLKTGLADRVRGIEDLQHRVQVQREAAVLLAQRIEVLSTKPWRDAQAALEVLGNDVRHWQAQADAIAADRDWASVDVKSPPQMDASRAQLLVVWDAFQAAVVQTVAAAADATAPLPPVPVWADELRAQRGVPTAVSEGAPAPQRPARPKIDPEVRAGASQAVREVLTKLEQEIAEGHGKASAGAAAALRNALKEHGRLIDDKLENQAHAALAAAGELEGWQRWRADQLRQELVAKAEALLVWPEPRPARTPRGPKPVRAPRGGAEAVAAAEPLAAESAAPEVAAGKAAVSEAAMSEAAAPETAVAEPAVTDQLAPVRFVPETADTGEQGADAPAPVVASAAHNDTLDAPSEPAVETASPGSTASEPAAVATAPTDAPPTTGRAQPQPAMGGRKLQETLRSLREQWKQTDQGGVPNHALWKRFDDACNEAHKFVEIWLDKIKAESAQTRAQRLALIEEVNAFTAANPTAKDGDWKGFNRILHQFSDRWRDAGHLSEKAFAELQPLWKAAMAAAHAPLEAVQKDSIARRHAMIDEAKELGAQPVLRIDAVKSLQQRWQAEAHTVPLDRKFEQKLWDTFRKPIDDAFNRKTAEREKAASELSDRDRAVLDAAKGLEAANASGDAQKIKAALAQLDAAMRGQAQARADMQAAQAAPANPMAATAPAGAPDVAAHAPAATQTADASADPENASNVPDVVASGSLDDMENVATDGASEAESSAVDGQDAAAPAESAAPAAPATPATPPKPAPKPVIAMRGDDRPGMKKAAPLQAGRGGKFGDRAGGSRGGPGGGASRPGDNKFEPRRDDRGPRDGARGPGGFGDRGFGGDRPAYEDRGPRLGDAAFRAQRDAVENAQAALRKLAAQAHGEALTQLLEAWEKRAADQVPGQQELGRAVSPAVRGAWSHSLGAAPAGNAAESASEALLRLEMAAEVPTPAEHISARRALQLQLLTRRNDPPPAQTWGPDAARVFAAPFDAAQARRLQNALKVLLKR